MKVKVSGKNAVLAAAMSVAAFSIVGCTSSSPPKSMARPDISKGRSKEYFSESEYGVKASPRVTNKRSRLQRGGGRDQVGKPYQVRGKWYYPREEPGYKKVGNASWYGDAFHGRLTANGEVYDMTHLTAAHPTMPLPSYARVTNLANGSSVIVRVNDRGPYSNGRVIDLSHKAADMLGYSVAGTARVKVEYVGRAPLDGQDEAYLVASYAPGAAAPDPSSGMPTGVMVAMDGSTPSDGQNEASEAFGALRGKPRIKGALSYASTEARPAAGALETLAAQSPAFAVSRDYVLVGTFTSRSEAVSMASKLGRDGAIAIQAERAKGGKTLFALTARPKSGKSADELLRQAWAAGASDAMTIRE